MTTTDTSEQQLIINRISKTQFDSVTPSNTELWAVDPEFTGGKLLATDSNGDIVETNVNPSSIGTVTSVNNVSPVNGNVTLSIPTVNDATLTITQDGVTKGTFTANSSTDTTIALDAGETYTAGTGLDLSSGEFSILQEDIGTPTPIIEVGSLTEQSGVYTGFNDNNYLEIPIDLEISATDSFEICFRVSNPNNTEKNILVGKKSNVDNTLFGTSSGLYYWKIVGHSIYLYDTYLMGAPFDDFTQPWYLKCVRTVSNGTSTIATYLSADGNTWLQHTSRYNPSYTNTAQSATYTNLEIKPFTGGTLYSNDCYIKINGTTIWSPEDNTYKPVVKATNSLYGLVKPDGTSITVSDGVISAATPSGMQTTSNLVTSVSSSSTDTQYPSAKCVYDIVGNIETLLAAI